MDPPTEARLPEWPIRVSSGVPTGLDVSHLLDADGDGRAAPLDCDDSRDALHVSFVPFAPGEHLLSQADVTWTSEAAGDQAGVSVAAVGDFDGDGADDLLITSGSMIHLLQGRPR